MTTTTGTQAGIESTIELLQTELPELEARQHTLEKDLAAVTERLEVVRAALRSLQALGSAPALAVTEAPAAPAAEEAAEPQAEEQAEEEAEAAQVPAQRKAAEVAKSRGGRRRASAEAKAKAKAKPVTRRAAGRTAAKKAPSKRTPGLTEGVVACLAKAKAPMRAGEVNEALGRDNSAGSVNSVRTALERLAAGSRVHRVGRGLYAVATG